MNIKKCLLPAPKLHNFQKLPKTKSRKLFLPYVSKSRIRKLGHFLPGMIHFLIFTAKKELIFLFQMAPTRSLYDHQFWRYEFLNLLIFFVFFQKFIFFIDRIFQPYVTIEKSQDVTQFGPNFYDVNFCTSIRFLE